MDSERRSLIYWQQVPHSELPVYASGEKTPGELEALRHTFMPADRILDLGCGWGRIALALAAEGYDVTGVDLSENLIAYARQSAARSGLSVCFGVGSMLSISFSEASFDKTICMWGVFNHLLTPAEQLRATNEIYRVLRPEGMAFIEMGNGERKKYTEIVATEGTGHENRVWHSQYKEGPPPNVLYIHDRKTLTRIAEQAHFENFRVQFKNINHRRRIVTYLYKSEHAE